MLRRLLQRFCAPIVVSTASKEQLCLALASVAHLLPPSPAMRATPTGSPAVLTASEEAALAARASRLAPSCSARELGMIASGCARLMTSRPELVDRLAKEMLWRCERPRPDTASSSLQIEDLTHLLNAAIAAGGFFNVTVQALASRHAPELLRQDGPRDRAGAVTEFMRAAEIYFGGGALVRKEVVAPLREVARALGGEAESTAAALTDAAYEAVAHAKATVAAVCARRDVLSSQLREPPPQAGPGVATRAVMAGTLYESGELTARRRLFDLAAYAAEGVERPAWITVEVLADAMREIAHYRLCDPVGQRGVEALVLQLRCALDEVSSRRLDEVAYAHPHVFPQLCQRMRSETVGGAAQGQLARTSAAAAAFVALVAGRRGSEAALQDIAELQDAGSADSVAYVAALMAAQRTVPSHLAAAVTAHVPTLSLAGIAAVAWAAARDSTGALDAPAAAALRRLCESPLLCGPHTSIDDAALLLAALRQPPRRLRAAPAIADGGAAASAAVVVADALLERTLAREAAQPERELSELLAAGALAATLAPAEDFVVVLSDRVAKTPRPLTREEVVGALALLAARPDQVHEALVDRVASAFAAAVDAALAQGYRCTEDLDMVLDVVRLQLRLDAPELEAPASRLLHGVEAAVASAPEASTPPSVQLLTAGALLAAQQRRPAALAAIAEALTSALTEAAGGAAWLTRGTAGAVAELVARMTPAHAPPGLTARLADAFVPHYAEDEVRGGAAAETTVQRLARAAGPLSLTDASAAFVAAYCRLCSSDAFFDEVGGAPGSAGPTPLPTVPLPPVAVAAVEQSLVTGLAPATFAALCLSAHRAPPSLVPPSLGDALVEALPRVLDHLTPAEIARCVWGLGQLPDAGLRLSHQLTSEAVADYVVDCAELFWRGPAIAEMLYGFSRLHCTRRGLYSVFAQRLALRPVRATMHRLAVGMALSAFGAVKFLDKELFDRYAAAYVRHAPTLTPADLLQSVKAHSRVMLLNDAFYDAMAEEVVGRARDTFPLHAQCELLRAYGDVGQRCDPLAERLVGQIAAEADALPDANAAVDVLTSLWLMDYDLAGDARVQPLVRRVEEDASQLTCTSLLRLCSILTDRSWVQPRLLTAMGDQCVALRRAQELTPEAARATLDVMARYHLSHPRARTDLAQLARTVSKEVPQLSEEEADAMKLLLAR